MKKKIKSGGSYKDNDTVKKIITLTSGDSLHEQCFSSPGRSSPGVLRGEEEGGGGGGECRWGTRCLRKLESPRSGGSRC